MGTMRVMRPMRVIMPMRVEVVMLLVEMHMHAGASGKVSFHCRGIDLRAVDIQRLQAFQFGNLIEHSRRDGHVNQVQPTQPR